MPWQRLYAGQWQALEQLLTELQFVDAKCAAGMVNDLHADYALVLDTLPEAQAEMEQETGDRQRVARYTKELVAFAAAWSSARERHTGDPVTHPMPRREEIPLPEMLPSACIWTDEQVLADAERIVQNPTRLDRIRAFASFVRSESHDLLKCAVEIPGFCLQQAHNYANAGPVVEAAERALNSLDNEVLLLKDRRQCVPYNPYPAVLRTLAGHTDSVECTSLSADGKIAVSGSKDRTLRVWDLPTGQCLHTLEGHGGEVDCVAMTPDGKTAVSGSRDQTVRVWDLPTGRSLWTLVGHTDAITCIDLTPDGKTAISGSRDQTLRVWKLTSGQCPRTMSGPVRTVVLTPDGKLAASGSKDRTLRIWDIVTGACLQTLEGHSHPVKSISLAADGKTLVSASLTISATPGATPEKGVKTLRIWNLQTGECLHTLPGHGGWGTMSVQLTADGTTAVSVGNDRTLRIWDLGKGVVSVNSDNTLRVWNLPTWQCIAVLPCPGGIIEIPRTITNRQIVLATSGLDIELVTLHGMKFGTPIVTAIRRWLYGTNGMDGRWDDHLTAFCIHCGQRFLVPPVVLDAIHYITRHLLFHQSPCLTLPGEAWDEPQLLSECPVCHELLKFNPFVVDLRELQISESGPLSTNGSR